MGQVVQSSWPGSRAPHVWLEDGSSSLDMFGKGFILLRFGAPRPDDQNLPQAAAALDVPLVLRDVHSATAAKLYERRLVLVRPDGHVAWRGDDPPADASTTMGTIVGRA